MQNLYSNRLNHYERRLKIENLPQSCRNIYQSKQINKNVKYSYYKSICDHEFKRVNDSIR